MPLGKALLDWAWDGLDDEDRDRWGERQQADAEPPRKLGAPKRRQIGPYLYTEEKQTPEEEDWEKRYDEAKRGGKKLVPRDYSEYELAQYTNRLARESGTAEPYEDKRPYSEEQEKDAFKKHVEAWAELPNRFFIRGQEWAGQRIDKDMAEASQAVLARGLQAREAGKKSFFDSPRIGGIGMANASALADEMAQAERKVPVPKHTLNEDAVQAAVEDFRREFPELDDEAFRKSYIEQADQRYQSAVIDQYATAWEKGAFGDPEAGLKYLPFARDAKALSTATGVLRSMEAIKAGEATTADYREVGQFVGEMREAERRGAFNPVELAAGLPATMVEFLALGGVAKNVIGSTLGKGITFAAKKAVQQGVPKALVRGAAGATTGLATVGLQAGLNVPAVAARTQEQVLRHNLREMDNPDEWTSFASKLPVGYGQVFTEIASERLGGLLGRIPLPVRVRAFRKAFESLGKTGYHGPLGESLEERASELGQYAIDARSDAGASGAIYRGLVDPGATPEDRTATYQRVREAYGQLASEITAFALPGLGANLAARGIDAADARRVNKMLAELGLDRSQARAQLIQELSDLSERVAVQRVEQAATQTGRLPINFPDEANQRILSDEEAQPYVDEYRRDSLPTVRPGEDSTIDDPAVQPTQEFVPTAEDIDTRILTQEELDAERGRAIQQRLGGALPASLVQAQEQRFLTQDEIAASQQPSYTRPPVQGWRTPLADSAEPETVILANEREQHPTQPQPETPIETPAPAQAAAAPQELAAPAQEPVPAPAESTDTVTELPDGREVVTADPGITQEARSIVEKKVRSLGSQAEVESFYDGDTAADKYAREFAKTVYQAGAEQRVAEPSAPAPPKAKMGSRVRREQLQRERESAKATATTPAGDVVARAEVVKPVVPSKRKLGQPKRQPEEAVPSHMTEPGTYSQADLDALTPGQQRSLARRFGLPSSGSIRNVYADLLTRARSEEAVPAPASATQPQATAEPSIPLNQMQRSAIERIKREIASGNSMAERITSAAGADTTLLDDIWSATGLWTNEWVRTIDTNWGYWERGIKSAEDAKRMHESISARMGRINDDLIPKLEAAGHKEAAAFYRDYAIPLLAEAKQQFGPADITATTTTGAQPKRKLGTPKLAVPAVPPAKSAARQQVEAWLTSPEARPTIRSAVKRAGYRWDDDLHDAIVVKALEKADQFNPEKSKVGTWVTGLMGQRAMIDELRSRNLIKVPHGKELVAVQALGEAEGAKPEPTGKVRGITAMERQPDQFRLKQEQEAVPEMNEAQFNRFWDDTADSDELALEPAKQGPPRVATQTDDTAGLPAVSQHRVLREIAADFGVPIHIGNIRKRAFAIYKVKPEVVRYSGRWYGQLGVGSHEIAHHFEKKSGVLQKIAAGKQAELASLDYNSKRGNPREGFAEYVRMYLTQDGVAQQRAPVFTKAFEKFLDSRPEDKAKFERARESIDQWRQQGAEKRAQAVINYTGRETEPSLRQSFGSWMDKMRQWTTDRFLPLYRFQQIAEQKLGRKLLPTENPYVLALTSAGKAAHQAGEAFKNGVFSLQTGERMSGGLADVLAGFKTEQELKDFDTYLAAERILDVKSRNPGYEAPMSQEDAQVFVDKHRAKFENAGKRFVKYHDALVDMFAEVGGLSDQAVQLMKDSRDFYAPLLRVMEGTNKLGSASGSLAHIASPLRRMSEGGSGRQIISPLTATLLMTEQLYQSAHKVRIGAAMARVSEAGEGLGELIYEVKDKDRLDEHKKVVGEIKSQIEKSGGHLSDSDVDALASVIGSNAFYRGKEPLISVIVNGQRKEYRLHPELYEAITEVDQKFLHPILEMTLGKVSRGVRTGAVGLRPSFGLGANPIRDAFTLARNTSEPGVLFGPGKQVARMVGNILFRLPADYLRPTLLGRKLGMRQDRNATFELYERLMGDIGGELGQNVRDNYNTIQSIWNGAKNPYVNVVKHPLKMLESFLAHTEKSARLAEFEAILNRHGYNPDVVDQGVPSDVLLEALLGTQNVTQNFQKGGSAMMSLNRVAAFANAALQGPIQTAERFAERPTLLTLRAITHLTLPALAMWYFFKDEDWWKELPQHIRYGFFFVPPKDKKDKPFAIPLPFEYGMMFAGMPVALADSEYQKDPKRMQQWADEFAKQIGITPKSVLDRYSPDAIQLPFELMMNYTLHRDRHLVGKELEQLEPKDQFYEYNTEASKYLGWLFSQKNPYDETLATGGISPAKIDHLIGGLTGNLGTDLLRIPEEGPFRALGYSRFLKPVDRGESIDEFYGKKQELERMSVSAKQAGKSLPTAHAIDQERFDRAGTLMTAIRREAVKIKDKDERGQFYRYSTGAARFALGKKELDDYPNPFTAKDVPEGVAAARDHILSIVAGKVSANTPARHAGENVTKYKERRAEWEQNKQEGQAFLDALNITKNEARQASLRHEKRKRQQ